MAVEGTWAELRPGADLVRDRSDASVTLEVRNTYEHAIQLEPRVTFHGAGKTTQEVLPHLWLDREADGTIDIELPERLHDLEHPAQVLVALRPFDAGRRMADVLPPALFFHAEGPDRLLVYDQEGLTTRHRGGDLLGRFDVPDSEREHLVAVGRARVADPDELTGDPGDYDDSIDGQSAPSFLSRPHPKH